MRRGGRARHRGRRPVPPKGVLMQPPIVLIHGLWLTSRSWEGWKGRFEQRGHEVLAPAWPRMDREVEEIRRDPSGMNGLGVTEVIAHCDRVMHVLGTAAEGMGH